MKLLIIHITGLATPGHEELGGRTLLQSATVNALDETARYGSCGTVALLPEGEIGGAGWELLALLGYADEEGGRARSAPTGEGGLLPSLGALEATAIGAPLYARDVAFRVNLSSLGESGVVGGTSGGEVATEDALVLMETVDRKLSTRRLRFYPGRHAAHVMAWTDGPVGIECTPAPLAEGKPVEEVLPRGEGDGALRQLIWDSVELLNGHRINYRRVEEGLAPVNLVWPWAPGLPPNLRHFALKTGLKAAASATRLEVLGAARAAGLHTQAVGAELGDLHAALVAAGAENALAYAHLDLPPLFEHPTDPEAHLRAVTRLDTELVAPVLREVRKSAEAVRLVVLATWPEEGWGVRPPALWGAFPGLRGRSAIADEFSEPALAEGREAEAHELFREARAETV